MNLMLEPIEITEPINLHIAQHILKETMFDGFFGMVVDGVQRVGKSSYVIKGLAFANGEWVYEPEPHCVKPDYESVKEWMVFKPEEFLDTVLRIGIDEKEKCLIWDDCGVWLFSLDWYEPFVKAVSRWMQVAGTQFASIILTTPDRSMISSKVLAALPNQYICHVTKAARDTHRKRPRVAKAYQKWNYPDGRVGGVHTRWTDDFNAMLPSEIYEWYSPIRKGYLTEAKEIMKDNIENIHKKQSKKDKEETMEKVHKATGGDEKLREALEAIDSSTNP